VTTFYHALSTSGTRSYLNVDGDEQEEEEEEWGEREGEK